MYYKLDSKTLTFNKVKWIPLFLKFFAGFLFLVFLFGWNFRIKHDNEFTESEVNVIITKHYEFSKEKFENKLLSLNFKFPHIVYAQAILETGNFKSKIFEENNNLFGMREATKRISTAKGTQYEHAYYDNWIESLYDYALYSSRYLSKINTEEDYYEYLSQNYAEAGNYVNELKKIVAEDKLKEKVINYK